MSCDVCCRNGKKVVLTKTSLGRVCDVGVTGKSKQMVDGSDRVSRAGQEFASANLRGDECRPDLVDLSEYRWFSALVVDSVSFGRVSSMLITFIPHKCSKRVGLLGLDQTDLETLFSDGRAVLLTDALDQQRFSDNRFVL